MKRAAKIFVAYFPVLLVAGQVVVNWLSFVWPFGYMKAAFYLNTFFGVNVFIALMLVAMTQLLKFCSVSRWAALAELFFAVNYLIVQQDNLYNIMFQIIIGTIAIIATFFHYIKKFPGCNLSVGAEFIKSAFKSGSCTKSLEEFDSNVKRVYEKHHS